MTRHIRLPSGRLVVFLSCLIACGCLMSCGLAAPDDSGMSDTEDPPYQVGIDVPTWVLGEDGTQVIPASPGSLAPDTVRVLAEAMPGDQYLTVSFTLYSSRLKVDLTLLGGETARVAILLEKASKPALGMGLEDCDPISVASGAQIVTWNGSSDLSSLKNSTIRLLITLHD